MLAGFPRTRWPRLRFSESYAVRISVKISRICEFRVIMGIMTGLLGCCSSSTLGSRANDYVKTLATRGFWLHHSPCSLGCWTNNTLVARSLSPKRHELDDVNDREIYIETHQAATPDRPLTLFLLLLLLNALINDIYVLKPLGTFCITILTVFIIGHLNSTGPVSITKQSLCIIQQTGTVPWGSVCEGLAMKTCFLKAGFPTIHVRRRKG